MSKKRDRAPEAAGLRARAEERLREREAREVAPASSEADAARLVHELQVHQIELEMQNEELRRSRAQAESALALYSELYDFAPVGYFTLGPEGTIRRANLTGALLLGTERARLVDRRLGAFLAGASVPEFNAALATVFDGEAQASCEVQLAAPRVDGGGPTWLQLTFSGAAGDAARVAAFDITERRRTEDLLRSSQKMEAIGRLAGGVAHDFNNLLTIILGGADAALAAAREGKSPREDLLQVTDAAHHAAALTRKLLAFGRKQLLRPQVVDVNELTRGLTSLLRAVLGERIELVMELSPDLGRSEVDPAQLEQVILNLVVNAHDAMPQGGRLTVSTANANVEAGRRRAVKPGSYVVLTVSDTGIGMDGETMAHIFEPFFSTKQRGQGTGLGLASVAGIVEQCGGEIAVRSEPGSGTTFDVYLPRASAPAGVSAAPQSKDPARGGTETILVVDDEEPLRRIAKRILEAAGYAVLVAGSGAEALSICAQHPGAIHLLVSDVVMPGMTGAALAGLVREARPGTRVLFMSGYAHDALGHGAILDRDVHFMSKPFSAEQLKTNVREVLDLGV